MTKKRVFFLHLVSAVLSIALCVGLLSAAVSTSNYTADMVEGVIEEFISASGTTDMEIIGQGSYIKKSGFRDPLLGGSSDFDMRIRLKNANVSPEEAARRWVEVQNRIRQIVQKKFGNMTFMINGKPVNAAQAILQKINLYPPQQIMKGVTSKSQAYALFKRYGIVPNLGYEAGSGTDDILEEAAEGIWGSGAVIQEMEKGARGKRWFTDGTTNSDGTKKVLTGSPGEIHAEEGIGGITAQERANVAKQVAEKTSSALGSDPDLVKKNLGRLQRYLKQAKLLAGVKPSANDAMLERLVQELEKLEGEALEKALASKAGAIERVLLDAWTDAHLLEQIATKTGALNRALYGGMLESSGKWASVRGLLNDAEFKAFAKRQAFLAAIVLVWESPELYRKASKEGVASAATYATATLIAAAMPLTAHLLSMAAMWIAEQMVDYVAGYGYDAVIATQDCKDLLAGLYTVYGREAQVLKEKLPRPSTEVQDLRAYYCRNARFSDTQMSSNLSTLVQAHSENACTRYEDYKASTDANAAVALFNKCFPALQRLLLLEKQGAAYEARALLQQLKALAVEPYYDKGEAVLAKGKATVRITAPLTIDPASFETDLATILRCLGGGDKNPGVYYRYKWYAGQAQAGDKPLETTDGKRNSRSYIFEKAGTHKVCVVLETDVTGISFELFRELEDTTVSRNPVCIDVEIRDGGDKEPGDKGEKPGAGDPKDGQKPPPQVQPGSYTQPSGQAGVQGGASGQAGITSGVSGQAGIQGGTSGQAGITAGVSGQAGVQGGTTGQPGVTSGASGQTGVQSGTSGQPGITAGVTGQTGLTSGVSTGTGVGLTSTPPAPPKEPPACTYEYSAWGECNRGTKKQTRTVTAKQPVGCVEKGKPDLERGCTPPPTEEEKRNSYLNCLCRCSSGWAGHIGVWYDPENKTKPECKSSGPCIGGIGALGCSSRHFFRAPDDCAKGCYEGAYGKGTYDEKKADKIRRDENKKFKEPLKLKINEKCPITAQLGDIVTLTASVEGGIPPQKFTWTGNGQAKDNTFTFANSRQPGPHPISVTVTDDDGGSATAACTVMVEALTVKIVLLDKETKIPIGESRNFSGTVMSGDKPARGDFYFLWQPHPEILFSPFEKTGGNVSGTKAKFNKLGKFKVWVIAHTYKGNVKTTIGESEQIEIEVSKPEIKLAFQPQTPKVGQEVKLTVTEKPKMDDKAISFWWEISGNTLNPGPLKGEREYTFKPKDTKPVTVTVHGKARDGGDDLGQDKAAITAQEYTVSLSEPKYMGSKPKIWKCDTQLGRAADCGLVEVTNQLAVFHDIFIKASVSPEPDKPPLRYAWTIDPAGICGIPGGGQELRINCSQTGTYTVKATVRDSQDIVLGTATSPVSITISQDDLNKAKGPLVTLTADKASLKTGETAVIKAAVQGGKAPYTYRWKDGLDAKNDTARFTPKKSGTEKITLEITDAAGKKASADLSIKVERASLEVTLKPAKTNIKLGETVDIRAETKGGEAPFTYAWSPEVEGKGDSVPYIAKKGGAQTVSVEVTDGARQKVKATVELKVEVPKIEVTLKTDKTTMKIGETALIQAIVKGGAPPVTSKWSADVAAKGEAANFTPQKSGAYKITVDVSDSVKQTANAGIEIKVEPTKLEVTLKTDKTTLKLGETAMLQAVVKGGEPPFVSQWGSSVEGKGESGRFVADRPGTHKASLDVSDKAGQKASASVDLKVEVPKLEVALASDKPTLKVGETGTIRAKVKGGMPDYTYQWSSFVAGKGETAAFTPKKAGLYKVWLEVRDKTGGKATASLDWKVEEGGNGQKPQVEGAEKIAIEPENLKLALGATQTLQVMRVLPDGRKEPYSRGKVSWRGDSSQGIVIGEQGNIQTDSRAKVGARVRIGVEAGPLKAEAWVEVVSASKAASQPVSGLAGPSPAATSTVPAAGAPTSSTPGPASLPTLTIEPKSLLISFGKSADLKVFTVQDGRKVADVTGQCTLLVSPGSGVRIDRNGRITVERTARPGTVEPVLATLKHPSGATLRADGIIRIEGTATLSSGGYDPKTDPGKASTMKPADLEKVSKIVTDFQKGQWNPLDSKEQKVKEQPAGQAQSPGYLSSSTTTTPTTVPPGGTTTPTTVPPGGTITPTTVSPGGTSTPTTVRPGGTTTATTAKPTTVKPTTTITGTTPQNLTDVTVDRRDVTITVWDHGAEDGDIITIYLNGKVLKSKLLLTNKKQSFQVKLTGGQNRFEVEAVNEGSSPPNTATVEISNVTKGKPSQVYERKTGQRTSMNLTAP